MQSVLNPPSQSAPAFLDRKRTVEIIAVMWVALRVTWLCGRWIAPDHDFPVFTYFVNGGSLAIGLAGLAGLLANARWGWWTLVVASIVQLLLSVPEVFGLPGILRVMSIAAVLTFTACLVLLFRPGIRPHKGAR
ncbi:MAG: hypothetical protein ACKVVT_05805 [Dehalococcoidia bacterium]